LRSTRNCVALLFLLSTGALCQQPAAGANQTVSTDPQTVIVSGSFEPIPLSETDRSVVSLDTDNQPLLYNSVEDYLRLDSSVDLEERGPDGVQADLSIRGASFEQSLVLLNGLRINDAQSGHHDMDIPLPLEAISRIEVLHGAGSTLYGADAMGGAVNFRRRPRSAPRSVSETLVSTSNGSSDPTLAPAGRSQLTPAEIPRAASGRIETIRAAPRRRRRAFGRS
jgi:outer membrane cobalamin receptor